MRAVRAEHHGAVVVTERVPVPPLPVALVPGVGHLLDAAPQRARRRPRGERRRRVNAAPAGRPRGAAHDAPVAVVAGAGSEHVGARARREGRGRRARDAPGRADVPGGQRIQHRRARRAPVVPAAACPAAAAAGEYQGTRSAPPVRRRPRRVALRHELPGVAPPARRATCIRRRQGLAGPGGRRRGRRPRAQRRHRRSEIREDVRLGVGLVPHLVVLERQRLRAEACPIRIRHRRISTHRLSNAATCDPQLALLFLPSPASKQA
ncbi:hypothetical protein PR202_gb05533 [Eleusine coracana subsp. coracana]|uniref:Uncharacterized protein n=1 Tax=Eleusine coracana subsp. coracana TaxID=191504 RepID=A0AAV5E787_ELECO|nr:hypothetical protein PR202_gb05533 [Eleusine coracana subsp. coracana]